MKYIQSKEYRQKKRIETFREQTGLSADVTGHDMGIIEKRIIDVKKGEQQTLKSRLPWVKV